MSVDASLNRAARVVAKTDDRHRADRVLREELARHGRWSPTEKRDVVTAVFAFFRWLPWCDPRESLQKQIDAALRLQKRFNTDPASVTPRLATRAVPAWSHDEVAWTDADLAALQQPPRLWLRAPVATAATLGSELGGLEPAPPPAHATGFSYHSEQDLFRTAAYHAGAFEIQDLGSQLVGHACAPRPGETWWDACAGEGGKTLHLADLMAGKGTVWATDRNTRRLAQLKRRAARAGVFNYRSAPWDGGPALPTRTQFDGILVDAPCSGLGTWRRNPQARWTTTPQDVAELAVVQRQLLENALPALKPGGRLIYAVCTLARSETTAIADAFSAAHPELEPLPLLDRGPQVTLGLAEWNANGMFLAGWKRP